MLKQELAKVVKQRTELEKKLDKFTKTGISADKIPEFNELCRQEFILSMKERLLNRGPGDLRGLMPPRIQRKVTINLSITKKPL